jgi:tetratricopeptide (TPR) repeat protein
MKITLLLAALFLSSLAIAQKKKDADDKILKLQYATELLKFNTTQDSSKVDFYYKRGGIRQDYNDFKKAIKDYDKAIVAEPGNYKIYYNRGMCKMDLKLFDDAIIDFTKSISITPSSGAYNNRAACKFLLQDYEGTIEDSGIAITFDPNNAEAYNNIGISLIRMGNKDEGCKYLNTAYSLGDKKSLKTIKKYCQ